MKKISKVAALLAASALLFGGMFLSCSDSDDDGNTSQVSGPSSNSGSGNSGSGNSGSGNSGNSGSGDNGGSGNQETATTDSWDFTTYANAVFVNPDAAGSIVVKSTTEKDVDGVKKTEYEKDGTYYLSADATQLGAEGNLSLTLSKAGTGKTNTTNKNGAAYSYQEGSTSGLRIKYDAFKIASVKGKVALTIEWYCIQGKDANDRNLELRIGDSVTVESIGNDSTKDASASVKMTNVFKEFDAGTGTNIYIGASNNIFIKSITIAKQAGAFTASTNNTTANDVVTLGLAGISVSSSADTVATAALSDGKVAITSVGAGEAVITVEDANGKKATIAVTVASSGDITLGAITKYVVAAPAKDTDFAVEELKLTAKVAGLEYKAADATDYTTIAKDAEATLEAGSYAIRFAAVEGAYAASADTSFTAAVAPAGGETTEDSWTLTGSANGILGVTSSSSTTLTSNQTLQGTSGALTLLASATGTGVGTSKKNAPSYKYVSAKGLCIKNAALEIAGVTGAVTLTINFYQNSTSDRNLEVTVGSDGTTESISAGTTQGDCTPYTVSFTGNNTPIYIGASNELYIKSIVIAKKAE